MDDALRTAQLRQMKRRATGLLVVVTAAFFAIAVQPSDATWVDYALAAAEGSMVGGLADWFAVTALFRHPLGLPIPHTAIIRERKDQFGETLGSFVQQNFLSPENVSERIRTAQVAPRTAAWLSDPGNARTVARSVLEALAAAADLVGDDDVHRLLHDEVDRVVRSIPFGPLAGRGLRVAMAEGRHQPLVDAALRTAITVLDEQREPLRATFGQASPWWLPGAVEDRLFDRIVDGARLLLASVAADPDHELRRTLDQRLVELADRLEHDPATAAKVDGLVRDAMARPEIRTWTRGLWGDVKTALHEQAGDPASRLMVRLSEAVAAIGQRLGQDVVLQERLAGAAEAAVRHVAERHQAEISNLISATISRWDAEETSWKLELLLGRDLQFIRINGTVVGGMAGLAIHGVVDLLR